MIHTIVLASQNKGKLAEFSTLLAQKNIQVRTLGDFSQAQADETGKSFIENALIKARHATSITNLPALADDSGICVDALGDYPSIYSARWHEYAPKLLPHLCNDFALPKQMPADKQNIAMLLHNLQCLEKSGAVDGYLGMSARFVCALALVRYSDDPMPIIAVGEWVGKIGAPCGIGGFGYDPIFYIDDKSAAQIDKSVFSHRAKALQALLAQL